MQIIFNYNYSMFQLGLKQKRTNNEQQQKSPSIDPGPN